MSTAPNISLTQLQHDMLRAPLDHHLAVLSGRGPGKSYGAAIMSWLQAARHQGSQTLVVRRSLPSLRDFEATMIAVGTTMFGAKAWTYLRQEHVFRLGQSTIELAPYEDQQAATRRLWGRSFQLICVDEVQLMPSMESIFGLRTSLRGAGGIKPRMVLLGNTRGPLSVQLHARFVSGRTPGKPFELAPDDKWIWMTGTLDGNQHIDRDHYRLSLLAANGYDRGRAAADIDGSWDDGSAFFDGCLTDDILLPADVEWRWQPQCGGGAYLALDPGWDDAAHLWAVVQVNSDRFRYGEMSFPVGSRLFIDEYSTADSEDPAKGLRVPLSVIADEAHILAERYNLPRPIRGVCDMDSSLGGQEIARVLQGYDLNLEPVAKGRGSRVSGWLRMRSMLQAAITGADSPQMWIHPRCTIGLSTMRTLPRDSRRSDDCQTRDVADHAADAARYALTYEVWVPRPAVFIG